MNAPEQHHAMIDALPLTPLAPDPRRAARTMEICRHHLVRHRARRERKAARRARALPVLAPLIVGAYGLLYAIALLVTALGLEEVIP